VLHYFIAALMCPIVKWFYGLLVHIYIRYHLVKPFIVDKISKKFGVLGNFQFLLFIFCNYWTNWLLYCCLLDCVISVADGCVYI